MELRRLRETAGMTLEYVAGALGASTSTVSRLERGRRSIATTVEEVSGLLGVMRVTGEERARIMRLVTGNNDQGWCESYDPNATDQVQTYLTLERSAKKIINVEPLLVPDLLQTADYCRTLFTALGADESTVRARMARRLGRQALLDSDLAPDCTFVMCELSLRQPFTSHLLMARQIRHIATEATHPNISIKIVPASAVAHPGLLGAFSILEFDNERPIVFIKGLTHGLFPHSPAKVVDYQAAARRQTNLALDEQQSIGLLHTIAEDLERRRLAAGLGADGADDQMPRFEARRPNHPDQEPYAELPHDLGTLAAPIECRALWTAPSALDATSRVGVGARRSPREGGSSHGATPS